MEEIWKDIEGYEGLYQVSNLGRVKSLKYRQSNNENILKPQVDGGGYLMVHLWKDKKPKAMKVHRLVAQAFIPNPDSLPEVNHKSEVKTENTVDEIEWCNHKYNCNYGSRNIRSGEKRKNNGGFVVIQFTNKGDYVNEYNSAREASRETGVLHSGICRCCQGKIQSAGGFIWKYKTPNNTTTAVSN